MKRSCLRACDGCGAPRPPADQFFSGAAARGQRQSVRPLMGSMRGGCPTLDQESRLRHSPSDKGFDLFTLTARADQRRHHKRTAMPKVAARYPPQETRLLCRTLDRQTDRAAGHWTGRWTELPDTGQVDGQSCRTLDRQTDRQDCRTPHRQTDRAAGHWTDRRTELPDTGQTDRQSCRTLDRQTDRQGCGTLDRQTDGQSCRALDRQTDRAAGHWTDRQTDKAAGATPCYYQETVSTQI